MKEGRQGSASFNVTAYRNANPDLRWSFGTYLPSYYLHYITNGQYEGRIATGSVTLIPVTSYKGIDYSNVYDFSIYMSINSDLGGPYNNNDAGALLPAVDADLRILGKGRLQPVLGPHRQHRAGKDDPPVGHQKEREHHQRGLPRAGPPFSGGRSNRQTSAGQMDRTRPYSKSGRPGRALPASARLSACGPAR